MQSENAVIHFFTNTTLLTSILLTYLAFYILLNIIFFFLLFLLQPAASKTITSLAKGVSTVFLKSLLILLLLTFAGLPPFPLFLTKLFLFLFFFKATPVFFIIFLLILNLFTMFFYLHMLRLLKLTGLKMFFKHFYVQLRVPSELYEFFVFITIILLNNFFFFDSCFLILKNIIV